MRRAAEGSVCNFGAEAVGYHCRNPKATVRLVSADVVHFASIDRAQRLPACVADEMAQRNPDSVKTGEASFGASAFLWASPIQGEMPKFRKIMSTFSAASSLLLSKGRGVQR